MVLITALESNLPSFLLNFCYPVSPSVFSTSSFISVQICGVLKYLHCKTSSARLHPLALGISQIRSEQPVLTAQLLDVQISVHALVSLSNAK